MTNDLRAAAERLRRIYAGEKPVAVYDPQQPKNRLGPWGEYERIHAAESQLATDEANLAHAYLATTRPDDVEIATPDWAACVLSPHKTRRILRYSGDKWIPTFMLSVNGSDWTYELPIGATRGQVRDLCRALGIELKETTHAE